ncbi:hypothetical protein Trydic_g13758 [Trypoxylus dichotomus]
MSYYSYRRPPRESTALLFSRSGLRIRRHGNPAELTFQGSIIPGRPQIKYLGVILGSQVNWGAHTRRVLDPRFQMSGTLHPLLIGRGKLNTSRKIRIYKTVLRPIATYASAVWVTAATTHMNKLQGIATRFFERAVDQWNPLVSLTQDYNPSISWRYPRPRSIIVIHQDRQQSAQPANRYPEMEPSQFVEDADSLEPKANWVDGRSGNWHPDEIETIFPPPRRHNSLEPKADVGGNF